MLGAKDGANVGTDEGFCVGAAEGNPPAVDGTCVGKNAAVVGARVADGARVGVNVGRGVGEPGRYVGADVGGASTHPNVS